MFLTTWVFVCLASQASDRQARILDIVFRPSPELQLALWLEDQEGRFVQTILVTRAVGTFGLGNRPGRADFGSGHHWPYGRREMVLPVWAHRRGKHYDRIVFQDCDEDALGWHEIESSNEPFYCRPTSPAENKVDTITCPTSRFNSDKGIPLRLIDPTGNELCRALKERVSEHSLYPPRNDIVQPAPSRDWSGVANMERMNDLDAVTRATPPGNQVYRTSFALPSHLPDGPYTVWLEANAEFDTNDHYDGDFFVDQALPDYGVPSAGQPSTVWMVPVVVGDQEFRAQSTDYVGYGSEDGSDGHLRPPDATITTDVPESGARRLRLTDGAPPYRLQAAFRLDSACASDAGSIEVMEAQHNFVALSFELTQTHRPHVLDYEVRYRSNFVPLDTEEAFQRAVPGPLVNVGPEQQKVRVQLDGLRADTPYTVAIRALNPCDRGALISNIQTRTQVRNFQTVDACFIATAAYGSGDANQVRTLRRFRDRVLMPHPVGRELVEAYYRLSPSLARFIKGHPHLQAMTRLMLRPLVWLAAHSE